MTRTVLLLASLSIASAAFRDEVTRDFHKTLAVKQGQKISIENRLGDVVVIGEKRGDVSIKALIRASARTRDEAEKLASAISIEVESASDITIRTKYPEGKRLRDVGFSVRYEIAMPESSPLGARNRFGRIDVQNANAGAVLSNANGSVTVRGGRGTLRAENSFGDTEVSAFHGGLQISQRNGPVEIADIGGAAAIDNSFGSVTAHRIQDSLTVKSRNGDIEAADIKGEANLSTSFGRIKATNVGMRLVSISTNSSIAASGIQGAVELQTSFGGIDVRGAANTVTATARNGDVRVESMANAGCMPVKIESSFGKIHLTLPSSADYDVSAQSTFGRIMSDFPMTISSAMASQSLTGKIGKGGCPLSLQGRNGDVSIHRAK